MNNVIAIGIPCLLTGGTEMHTYFLATLLANNGYKVFILCYYEYDRSIVSLIESTGARVLLFKLTRLNGSNNIIRMLLFIYTLNRYLKKVHPIVFHVQYMAPGLLATIVGHLSGPWHQFVTLHTPGHVYGWRVSTLRWVARRLCTAFICVSESIEKDIFGNSYVFDSITYSSLRKHFTIYNGVDIELIDSIIKNNSRFGIRKLYGLGSGPVIGCVARLNIEKGHSFLLDVFYQVSLSYPNAKLLLVGDGKCRNDLEIKVQQLGLNKSVIFAGWHKYEDALRSYMAMDIVAVPSLFEGFGLSAAEAMAFAKPVVGTLVNGLLNVIKPDETGYLIKYGDVHSMTNHIITLIDNIYLANKMGVLARSYVENNFSLDLYRFKWLSLYKTFIDTL